MSENKEYVSRSDELGNIHISEEVLAAITAAAALDVEGVSGLAANLGSDIAELLGYGHTIPEIGRAIQDGVKSAIESMTGLEVSVVNVSVAGITFPPKS